MTPRCPSSSGARAAMRCAPSRETLKVPTTLTWSTREKASSGYATPLRLTVFAAWRMPAQLMAEDTGSPYRDSARSRAADTCSSLVTSVGQKAAFSPSPAATAAPSDEGRSSRTTRAPDLIRCSAVARPSPDPPPLMTATCFASVLSIRSLQKFDEVFKGDKQPISPRRVVRETIYSNLSIYHLQLIPSALLWI